MPNRLLLFILDGCRPDALAAAPTPHIAALRNAGACTFTASSVMPSVTLPAHTSMFRGIDPARHGVGADNVFQPSAAAFPSILDLAAQTGLRTALFYSWEQLRDLAAPGSLHLSYCRSARAAEDGTDALVTQAFAAYVIAELPDFAVLYLGDIDLVGHAYGWMSPEYLQAVERSDAHIGLALNALEQVRLRDQYAALVLSDHGGHDTGHGTDLPDDMTIPWLIAGPGIKRGHAIQSPVNLCDTAATIAHYLNLPRPAAWEGQPVHEAFA